MSFSFRSLTADLQYRLRELCSPTEAFHLQIAAAGINNYVLPLQKVTFLVKLFAGTDDVYYTGEDIFFNYTPDKEHMIEVDLVPNEIVEVTSTFTLYRAEQVDMFQFWDDLIIKATIFEIEETNVSLDILEQAVCQFKKPITTFRAHDCTFYPTFIQLFDVMPHLEKIYFWQTPINSDWENDMVKLGKTDLRILNVSVSSAVGLRDLKYDVIKKLFEIQGSSFLCLIMCETYITYHDGFFDFVKPYFVQKETSALENELLFRTTSGHFYFSPSQDDGVVQ